MRRRGYFFRQLAWLIGIVALPLLSLLSYNLVRHAARSRDVAYQAVNNDASALAEDVEANLYSANRFLVFLKDRPLTLALDSRHCDPMLEGATRQRRNLANVLVTDNTGRPICLSVNGPGRAPESFGDYPWFVQAQHTDGLTVSKPFMAPVARRMVSAVSLPLKDASGRRIGTVSALIDLEGMQNGWSRYTLPEGSRQVVVDADGTIMAARPGFEALVGKDIGAVVQKAVAMNPTGTGVAPGVDGVERAFALKSISSGWRASASIPTRFVFAEYRSELQRSIAAALVVVLGTLALAALMARRMAAPLTSLGATAHAISAGDLLARADEALPGEFHHVAREFNAMLDAHQAARALLRESERRYADLFENVAMISLMLDTDGRVTHCNDYLLQLGGWTRAELIGADWWADCVPPDRQDVRNQFHAAIREGALSRDVEHDIITKSGGRRQIHWHNSLLRSDGAQVIGTASLGEDVTEIRLANEREKRHAEFYQALSRTNGAIVRMKDAMSLFQEICRICVEHGHASIAYVSLVKHGMVVPVAWSGPAEAFLVGFKVPLDPATAEGRGLTAEAARTGRIQVANRYHDDPRTMPWRDRAMAVATRSSATFAFRRAGIVAGTLSLHMTVEGFFDSRVIELVEEMASDISFALDNFEREAARRNSEQSAREEHQRFRLLFQTAPAAMSIASTADHRLLDVNESYAAFVDQPVGALVGRNAFDKQLWPGDAQRVAFLGELSVKGRVRNFEMRGRDASGRTRDYLLQADPLRFAEQACLLTIAIDVSDLRDAQSRLAAKDLAQAAAESASRAKTEFLSRMSHELRTPLNAVLGFSQLLQGDVVEPLSERHQDQVDHIRVAGWHLLALIDDVLDVAKIEAGRIDVDRCDVDLLQVLEEAIRLTESGARTAHIRIERPHAAVDRANVWADERRLRQVLVNVLSNAIKYNRRRGSVTVTLTADKDLTHVDISDTGMGMTAEQVEHLFEPFNRLGRERQGIEGTGLGLALTRQLVQLMNGVIDVTSTPGVGTRVRISLLSHETSSLVAQVQPAASVSRPRALAEPSGKVLYIEDNPVNLVLVEQLLLRWPEVELLQAENGADGIAMALVGKPDLILLDMRLPDMDGLTLLDKLKADAATRDIRVVSLSASAMPDDVASALRAGAIDYWTKPLNFDHFLAGMAQLLAMDAAAAPQS